MEMPFQSDIKRNRKSIVWKVWKVDLTQVIHKLDHQGADVKLSFDTECSFNL
jgi:hypothetical protein